MDLQHRINLMTQLGEYILSDGPQWNAAKEKAFLQNPWFTPEFINLSAHSIAQQFLQRNALEPWAAQYQVPDKKDKPLNVGIIMAGNIPLVGFHDFLCAFIAGHRQTIKTSSKDDVLIKHLADKLHQMDADTKAYISFADMLKGCDAYIATGSNNSARYFDYYFSKYPHIIRRNRTSVAVLTGEESRDELEALSDDVYRYFGLGCRNVTKLYVPKDYDFVPLLAAFGKYNYLADHHKYRNNYDYQLALMILNKTYYMTNGSVILREDASVFSPISQLHYEYYTSREEVMAGLQNNADIQAIAGKGQFPFGQLQQPRLMDYADGVDTMEFLMGLK
jgi:hypothetical protein